MTDKPKGWSSQKTVTVVKRRLGLPKAGHAGTLDPLATGLLVILAGQATKKFSEYKNLDKEYEATIVFGRETDTCDSGGKVTATFEGKVELDEIQVRQALSAFVGKIKQVPPEYSAVKVKGMPAYKRARLGEKVELKTREVIVKGIKVLEVEKDRVKLMLSVSSGTYIRSLARDVGRALGCGGYLESLRRTRVGEYTVEEAKLPGELQITDLRDH